MSASRESAASKTERHGGHGQDSDSTSGASEGEDEEALAEIKLGEDAGQSVKKSAHSPASPSSHPECQGPTVDQYGFTSMKLEKGYDSKSSPEDVSSSASQRPQAHHASVSTDTVSTFSSSPSTANPLPWSHLHKDVQFYLLYHRKHIHYHHYLWKTNAQHFFQHTLIDAALGFEPLLYAVVAFSAYHYSIEANGKISDFLGFYNKSLSSLRKSLSSKQAHSDGTVLAVLQLAAFEVSWPSRQATDCHG